MKVREIVYTETHKVAGTDRSRNLEALVLFLLYITISLLRSPLMLSPDTMLHPILPIYLPLLRLHNLCQMIEIPPVWTTKVSHKYRAKRLRK